MSHSMKIPLQSKLNLCKLLSRYNCSFRKSSESHYTFSFFTFDGKHQFPQIEFGHSVYFLSSFYVYSLWDEPLNIVVTTYIVYSSSCTVGKRAYAWNRGTARDAPRRHLPAEARKARHEAPNGIIAKYTMRNMRPSKGCNLNRYCWLLLAWYLSNY